MSIHKRESIHSCPSHVRYPLLFGLFDNAGTLVVEYEYDAWGKPTK